MKDTKTLKYPLRWLFQILLLTTIGIFIYKFISGSIVWESPNNNDSLYFVLLCIVEFFSIIYLLRNKTFFSVDKTNSKYIINRCKLTSEENKEDVDKFVTGHYLYGNKALDVLDGLDVLLSMPNSKEIQKAIKNKVLTFPKYQISKVNKLSSFLGMKFYKLEMKNNKKKYILTFNEL